MSSVDVIVPCYRYAHFLGECVQSVLSQCGPCVRVLIIDDASPDNTFAVATELASHDRRVEYVRHSTNRGHIATYNEGIGWASAEYLLLLSADDYLLPGALQRATLLMEKHPEVGFTFGNAVELENNRTKRTAAAVPCDSTERILTAQEFFAVSGARNIVPTPTAVVRTGLQKRVGNYRAELPHAGDMEMWLRLAAHAPVGFVSASQAVYRRHSGNMSLSYMGETWLPDLAQRRDAFDSFFRACGPVLADPARLRKSLSYQLASDAVSKASTAFNEGDLGLSRELAAFARHTSARVTRSLPWAKLLCKRTIGSWIWRKLQPAACSLVGRRSSEARWDA